MARRFRFTDEERHLLRQGADVEVLHGDHWHRGIVAGPADDAGTGIEGVPVRCPRTACTYEGEIVFPGPGAVRVTAKLAPDC